MYIGMLIRQPKPVFVSRIVLAKTGWMCKNECWGGGWCKEGRWSEISWAEKKKDCWERVGGEQGSGVKEQTGGRGGGGVKRKKQNKMHKQMLALGIDAISSVSQLMTNSMEESETEKDR